VPSARDRQADFTWLESYCQESNAAFCQPL
jgi:hypothetical protein